MKNIRSLLLSIGFLICGAQSAFALGSADCYFCPPRVCGGHGEWEPRGCHHPKPTVSFGAGETGVADAAEYVCEDFTTRSGYVLKAKTMGEDSDVLLLKKDLVSGAVIASAIYKNIGKNIITPHPETGLTHYDLHVGYKVHPDIPGLFRTMFLEYLQSDAKEFPYFILVKDEASVRKLDCFEMSSNNAE